MSRPDSVSLRAVAFVAFTCLCLIAMDVWEGWRARAVQLKEVEVAASNLSRAAAQDVEDTITQSDMALLGIVERLESEGADPLPMARMRRMMIMRVGQLKYLNGLFAYDERGDCIASSIRTISSYPKIVDREFFAFHQTHTGPGPHIGAPVRSRISGKWILPISRRVDHADGSFAGIAVATINIDYFEDFYSSLNIGQAGAIALVLDTGTMIVRRPFDDSFIGKNVRDSTLFQTYRAHGPDGIYTSPSSQDGVVRIFSYRRVDQYPLFVAAALSKDESLSQWWRETLVHSAGVGLLVAAIGFFGLRLTMQIRLRAHAETELIATQRALTNANKTLQRLAMQDGLTGLANRRQFDMTLEEEFARAKRLHSALAIIMIDVDYFKQYNDLYGHVAGDDCLRAISHAIQNLMSAQGGCVVARYGGEELAIVLSGGDALDPLAVAERIGRAVANLQITHAGSARGFVTVSAGVASLTPECPRPSDLVQLADKGLYAAKATGRNRALAGRQPGERCPH